jgi:hypothetical protein
MATKTSADGTDLALLLEQFQRSFIPLASRDGTGITKIGETPKISEAPRIAEARIGGAERKITGYRLSKVTP